MGSAGNPAFESSLVSDIDLARRGDISAFSRLVEKTQSMVCGVAFSIVRDVTASEDIAQEVYLSAWKGLAKLKNSKSFLPWLRQVTRNQANSWLRRIYSRRVHDHDGDDSLANVVDPQPSIQVSLEQQERLATLARALEEVPSEAREVLVLYYREGRSTAQVGALLGLSEAAVRKRLSRARQQIREDVAEQVRRGLEKTAPTAALVSTVIASIATSTGPASALSVGAVGARGLAAGGLKAGGALGFLGAVPGVLGGIGGVLFGLRREFEAAIDAREIEELCRFRRVAVLSVVVAGIGFGGSASTETWMVPTIVYFGFMATLGWLYFGWLPKIVHRRLESELASDPEAPKRHRRRRRLALLGFTVGGVSGGFGLLLGLWLSGMI